MVAALAGGTVGRRRRRAPTLRCGHSSQRVGDCSSLTGHVGDRWRAPSHAAPRVGGPVVMMVPSGKRMVSVRSGVRVRCQSSLWMLWWCCSHTGKQLSRSVQPVVAPPDDVVQLGAAVAHSAAGDRTGRVHGAEGAALRPVGESGGASEVEFAGGVDDHPVTHRHGVHDRGLGTDRRGPVGAARRVAPNR